jgi:hypothetical protein
MGGMKRDMTKTLGIAIASVCAALVLAGCFQNDLLAEARSLVNSTLTLTVIASEGGTTEPSGSLKVTPSVATDIAATASSGNQFINWEITSGVGASFGNETAASTNVTLTTGDVTVRANFNTWQVATPQFSVAQGTYVGAQSIEITCATSGAEIHYTTDSTDPTKASTPYTVPISLSTPDTTTTIKARAYKTGMADSIVASSTYTITGTVAAPVITPTPAATSPADSFSVSITCGTADASIRYTLNGTEPSTTAGALYSGTPFTVNTTCTVKAIAYKTDWDSSFATPVTLTSAWVKSYGSSASGETAYGIAKTPDGDFYVTGQSSASGYNRELMKITANGTVLWARSYNEPGAEIGSCIAVDTSGNAVTVGSNSSGSSNKAVTTKISPDGSSVLAMQWHHPFASEGGGATTLRSVKALPDGSFIALGETSDDMAPYQAVMLTKLYPTLVDQWAFRFNRSPASDNLGMKGYSVDVHKTGTTVNGFVFVGTINQTAGSSTWDILIVKTDASGAMQSSWVYGGSSTNDDDQAYGVRCTSDGGFIVVGKSKSVTLGQASYDVFIMKFNSAGTREWHKYYGALSTDDAAYAVEEVETGVYVVAGETTSFGVTGADAWVIKLDSSGNILWQKTYGGSGNEKATGICLADDGGYVICGSTTSYGTNGDYWVMKLAKDGRPLHTSGTLKLGVDSTAQVPSFTLSPQSITVATVAATTLPDEPQTASTSTVTFSTLRQYQP